MIDLLCKQYLTADIVNEIFDKVAKKFDLKFGQLLEYENLDTNFYKKDEALYAKQLLISNNTILRLVISDIKAEISNPNMLSSAAKLALEKIELYTNTILLAKLYATYGEDYRIYHNIQLKNSKNTLFIKNKDKFKSENKLNLIIENYYNEWSKRNNLIFDKLKHRDNLGKEQQEKLILNIANQVLKNDIKNDEKFNRYIKSSKLQKNSNTNFNTNKQDNKNFKLENFENN